MGGVSAAPQPSYGSKASYAPTVTQAAFGMGATVDAGSSMLSPKDPIGLAVWTGIAAVAALVFIRYSLPN